MNMNIQQSFPIERAERRVGLVAAVHFFATALPLVHFARQPTFLPTPPLAFAFAGSVFLRGSSLLDSRTSGPRFRTFRTFRTVGTWVRTAYYSGFE